MNRLGEHFGIRVLLLEGGGHINGAFLQADLVDEVSLLIVPGIDGRHDIDKLSVARLETDLEYVEQYENKVFHYRWALRNPVIKEAITRALANHLDPT